MNILVSGSRGFIASHLIPKLEKMGHKVVGMDIKNGMNEDVTDYANCFIKMRGIDCVIHLAAFTDVQESIGRPLPYYENNLGGLVNLLDVASSKKVKRFIFASSAAADSPQSPYGVTKLCGEHWLDVFNKCYGLSTVSLRFFNVYGKGTDKGVIPTWIKAIKKGERPVVYGGNQVRDFVYVEDVVRAIICTMEVDATGMYEVGTGLGVPIFDLAFVIGEAMKSELKIIPEERKVGDIEISVSRDTQRTLDYLGWTAKYKLIEQGLREMLK